MTFLVPPWPRQQPGPRLHEVPCQTRIVAHARRFGWLAHAERSSVNRSGKHSTAIQGDAGFPDVVLIHPPARRLLVVEVKRRPNNVEPAQLRWLEAFQLCGVDTTVWWVPEQLHEVYGLLADPFRRGVA